MSVGTGLMGVRKCFLHIGMHKTGSTTIQKFLFSNHDALEKVGVSYFLDHLPNHSLAMHAGFGNQNMLRKRFSGHPRLVEYLEPEHVRLRISRFLQASAALGHDVVISGEDIPMMDPAGVGRLADFIEAHGFSAVCVAYVRPPVSFVRSASQQMIKGRACFHDVSVQPPRARYRQKFEKFERVFGRSAIHYRPFKPNMLLGEDVVLDLLSFLALDELRTVYDRDRQSNKSMTLTAAKLLSSLRLAVEAEGGLRAETLPNELQRLVPIAVAHKGRSWQFGSLDQAFSAPYTFPRGLLTIPGPPFDVPEEVYSLIVDDPLEDVEWIEARLGLAIRDFDGLTGAPRPTLASLETLKEEELSRIGNFVENAFRQASDRHRRNRSLWPDPDAGFRGGGPGNRPRPSSWFGLVETDPTAARDRPVSAERPEREGQPRARRAVGSC